MCTLECPQGAKNICYSHFKTIENQHENKKGVYRRQMLISFNVDWTFI